MPGKRPTPTFENVPHSTTFNNVCQQLQLDNLETGLSNVQAAERLEKYGENVLDGGEGVSIWKIFFKQITNAMILVLILATALSYAVRDWIEAGVITAVIILNVAIGFYQEYSSEKTVDALRSLSSPTAVALREGELEHIPSKFVVPGDIIELKTGDVIPADLRLIEAMNFETDEALLTGESLPVAKDPLTQLDDEVPLGDRINLAFSSTTVTKGRSRGIVIGTGMSTAIGNIAASLNASQRKPNRSLSRKKHGPMQPAKGFLLRMWDFFGKLLGLTVGTPLQRKLAKLAYYLLGCALLLAVIVFGANKFVASHESTLYAISLGIAIIPESLIAVLTITMSVGIRRMVTRKVIVRKLDSLESLGGVTDICSDKTGTLTQGKMITRKVWIPNVGIYTVDSPASTNDPTSGTITLSSEHAQTVETLEQKEDARDQARSAQALTFEEPTRKGKETRFVEEEKTVESSDLIDSPTEIVPELAAFLKSSALCNLAKVRYNDQKSAWQATGDPTEIALQVFSHRLEHGKESLQQSGWRQKAEYPFDSDVKRMSVVFELEGQQHVFTKGAVERIIDLCTKIGHGDQEGKMSENVKEQVLKQMSKFADQGLRVLAIAAKRVPPQDDWKATLREDIENELTLLGLAGLYDPPRLETRNAIKQCGSAGIRIHMLTGDHPSTATAIAKECGILPRSPDNLAHGLYNSMVKTAAEFDKMTIEEIDAMPTLPLVIARCAPKTKTRMIDALHRRNLFAAMTGDGVNDSPSLKRADVGIGMGSGSDVAKSASDIVLTDDNFSSIVNAIEEGRRLFDNIQKFILHLLTSNVAEVLLLCVGLAFQDRESFSVFPLAPLQILWINMITSSFPAFGLGLEKASSDIMRRPPRKGSVFSKEILIDMLVYGTIMGGCCLISFVVIVYGVGDGELGTRCNQSYSEQCDIVFRARACIFAELTWLILISAVEFKSVRRSIFRLDPYQSESRFPLFKDLWENKFLLISVVVGALSVFIPIYAPTVNTNVFKQKGISWEWALAVGSVIVFVFSVEVWKFVKRYFGLFNGGKSDRVPKNPDLSFRQGFFTMSRTMTKGSSISRSNTNDKEMVSSIRASNSRSNTN